MDFAPPRISEVEKSLSRRKNPSLYPSPRFAIPLIYATFSIENTGTYFAADPDYFAPNARIEPIAAIVDAPWGDWC
jgi:hypothetical protein